MAAFVCDICGGNLSMDASGDFAVCESCGMKHTKDRIKVKAQEITGTVKVSNIAGVESLMKRGYLALEDSDFLQADEYFDRALDINHEYAPAYAGKLCAELGVSKEELLGDYESSVFENSNFQKAVRFANAEYREKLKGYDEKIRQRLLEEHYNGLIQAKNNASKELEFLDLAKKFREMNGYKDADDLAGECNNRYKILKDSREERERKRERLEAEERERLEIEEKKSGIFWAVFSSVSGGITVAVAAVFLIYGEDSNAFIFFFLLAPLCLYIYILMSSYISHFGFLQYQISKECGDGGLVLGFRTLIVLPIVIISVIIGVILADALPAKPFTVSIVISVIVGALMGYVFYRAFKLITDGFRDYAKFKEPFRWV
jgi:tetratricopeptide (TPR) repeat protein